MSGFPPVGLADWIASQEGRQGADPTVVVEQINGTVEVVAQRWVKEVTGQGLSAKDPARQSYLERVWGCLEFHWKKMAETGPIKLADVVARLETGQSCDGTRASSNVLREVMLIHALELFDEKASHVFDTEYMPAVRRIAHRTGGEAAVLEYGNLAADILLRREKKRGRYRGETSLLVWLRTVVINGWRSSLRPKKREISGEPFEPQTTADNVQIDASPCGKMLTPLVEKAVKSLERQALVMLKFLYLDDVQVTELALSYRIDPGTMSRRRKKATTQIFDQIKSLSMAEANPRHAKECLEMVLAGDLPELKQRLAELMTSAIRAADMAKPDSRSPDTPEVERS